MSKKCTSCGKEVVDEAKFCPGCGGSSFASQEIPATQYVQPVQQQVAPQPVQQQVPVAAKGGIKWWQILIIVVSVVAVIGIIAGIFLTKDGGSDKPDDDGGAVVEQREEKEEDNNVEIENEDAAENDAPVAESDELNGASVINYGSKKISLPCTVSDVLAAGIEFVDYYDIDASTTLAPGANTKAYLQGTADDANGSIKAYIVNFSDKAVKAGDATVIFIYFSNVTVPTVSANGITIGEAKVKDFEGFDVLADSGYIYAGTALCNIKFSIDSTYGFVDSISIENYPEDMKKYDVEYDFSNENMSFNKAKEAALFGRWVDIDKYYNENYEDYSAYNDDAKALPTFKSATVGGDTVVKFDMSYSEIKALGYSMKTENENKEASTSSYVNLYGLYNSDNKVFMAGFGSTKKGATCKEGNAIAFEFGNSGHTQLGDSNRSFYEDFEIFGLTQDSTIKDVVDMYGDPKDIYATIYDGEAAGKVTYYTSDEIKVEIEFDLLSGAIMTISVI